ncbi:MAG TPA: DUF3306 domain-containing protein [Ramlibacter sp.]|nr:DUF3306 domain-containing protein [Ramlibacter sp.]
MADGFLGRWSRRKLEVKEGKEVPPEPPPEATALRPEPVEGLAQPLPAAASPSSARTEEAEPPPPTLEDVQSLTPASDFSRFTGPKVAPEVKNAAMKKLFADPRFNVMDGLDVYIDDYSKPDPMPESMLRSLASAQFLKLFEDKPKAEAGPRDDADDPQAQTVAQSQAPSQAVPAAPPHADPDLRLQQDDAAEPPEAGDGAR